VLGGLRYSLVRQGITPIIADVAADSVETLADGMQGSDVVLFTARAGGRNGPEATTAVDGGVQRQLFFPIQRQL
jgi:hypothetical protein